MNEMDMIKFKLQQSLAIIGQFNWLINSNVLDFYVDNHWKCLPRAWQQVFRDFNPNLLADLLDTDKCVTTHCNIPLPLSLVCLKHLLKTLCIPREISHAGETYEPCAKHPKLKNLFNKHIKPKKSHEIKRMAEICSKTAELCDISYIIDFGSGLGHLARHLAHDFGLKVCCLEQQLDFTQQAKSIDAEIEEKSCKYFVNKEVPNLSRPVHLNFKLTKDVNLNHFVQNIRDALHIPETEAFKFGIIGLHPCADLAVILMKIFKECKEAKFINVVGCCYMKLSTELDENNFRGYPVSYYLNQSLNNSSLSHASREIACHAIEVYIKRLRLDDFEYLRIHSFRAAIEKIIVQQWPSRKHGCVRSVKYSTGLTFENYCAKAVENLNMDLPSEAIRSPEIDRNLADWRNVVIFYSLRLMFAPLIESVILYDRHLYLLENNCKTEIKALFDPLLSARNHVITSIK